MEDSMLLISILSGIAAGISIFILVFNTAQAQTLKAEREETYDSIRFNIEYEGAYSVWGNLNASLLHEVEDWNKWYVEYKAIAENEWFGVFYPAEVIENVDKISLKDTFGKGPEGER